MEAAAQTSQIYPMEGQFQTSMRMVNHNFKITVARAFGPKHPISRTHSSFHWSGWTGLSGPVRISAFSHLVYLWPLNYMCSAGNLLSGCQTMTPRQTTNQRMTLKTHEVLVVRRRPMAMSRPGDLTSSSRRRLQLKTSKARGFAVSRPANMPVVHLQSGHKSSQSVTVFSHEDEMKAFLATEWSKPQHWALRALENSRSTILPSQRSPRSKGTSNKSNELMGLSTSKISTTNRTLFDLLIPPSLYLAYP